MFTLVNGSCPLTAVEWTNLETAYCKDGGKYHCIPNENGQLGQVCTSPIWIQPNACPIFNTNIQKMDARLCDSRQPDCQIYHDYRSNRAYEYKACISSKEDTKTIAQFTTTEAQTNNITQSSIVTSGVNIPVWINLLVPLLALVVVAVLVGIFVYMRKMRGQNGNSKRDEEEEPMILLEDDPEVQQHVRDNTFYAGIEAVIEGWKTLTQYGVVILVGVTGAGKTKSGLELLSMVRKNNVGNRKYNSHILRNFDDIENKASKSSPCILLDDCLERWNYSRVDPTIEDDVIRLENIFNEYIQKKGALVVLTLNAHTWERCSSFCEGRKFFRKQHMIWLESLSNKMEIEILEKHLDNEKERRYRGVEEMMDTISKERRKQRYPQGFYRRALEAYGLIWQAFPWKKTCYLGFPGACAVFARDYKFWEMGEEFFKNPIDCLSTRFSEWRDSNVKTEREKYVVLVYMLMNGGQMDIRRINGALLYIAKSICNVDDDVSEDTVREGVAALARSYCVEKSPGFFVFQQEVIEYTLLSVAVLKHPRQIFENCDLNVLKRFMITKRNEKPEGELKLPVKSLFFDLLIKRFVMSRVNLVNHRCMEDERFKQKYDMASVNVV